MYIGEISLRTKRHLTWPNLPEMGKLSSIDPNPTLSLKGHRKRYCERD
jgi:hypothetical protein